MFRASLGEAHSKIRFTKPFSLKKKKERKKPQVHLNHLKIAVKKKKLTLYKEIAAENG